MVIVHSYVKLPEGTEAPLQTLVKFRAPREAYEGNCEQGHC